MSYEMRAAVDAIPTRTWTPPLPLALDFADELPDTPTPLDELVEDVLEIGKLSVVYGASNVGKTYAVLDMACAIARGIIWMDCRTEPGLVIYLAAEGPGSVRRRVQAYRQHHGVRVPNFAITRNAVNLFAADTDANNIIKAVQMIEKARGVKSQLIVGDTLARLSAGANENSGEDMGRVIERADRIREATGAHFLLIHHSGKNTANGARGWSGVRAAIDTEIEVTNAAQGRCMEITKQRDLSSNGKRIGFTLQGVTIGLTKWGTPDTSCVVLPADAPEKPKPGKRVSEVGGAIVEYLRTQAGGVKKKDIAKHFDGRYDSSNVYRQLKSLAAAGTVHEAAGMVALSGALR